MTGLTEDLGEFGRRPSPTWHSVFSPQLQSAQLLSYQYADFFNRLLVDTFHLNRNAIGDVFFCTLPLETVLDIEEVIRMVGVDTLRELLADYSRGILTIYDNPRLPAYLSDCFGKLIPHLRLVDFSRYPHVEIALQMPISTEELKVIISQVFYLTEPLHLVKYGALCGASLGYELYDENGNYIDQIGMRHPLDAAFQNEVEVYFRKRKLAALIGAPEPPYPVCD